MSIDQFTQSTMQAKAPSKSNEKSEDIFDDLMKSLARGLGGAFKMIPGMSWASKVFEVGVFANVKLEDAGIKVSKAMNEGMANFTEMRGGPAAEAIMGGLQFDSIKDFSKLVAAAIEPIQHMVADGLQGTDVPRGDIGQLYVQAGLPNAIGMSGLSVG